MRAIRRGASAAIIVLSSILAAAPGGLFAGTYIFPPPAGPYLNSGTGHWYFRTVVDDYAQARDFATVVDGYIVSILDVAEQQWLVSQFLGNNTSIGLTDEGSPGVFYWLSGEPVGFTDWASGPPPASFAPLHARGFVDWFPDTQEDAGNTVIEVDTPVLPFVPSISCEGELGGTTLTWSAPGFDEVRILRDGQVIATLPASAGSTFDATSPGTHVYLLAARSSAGTSLPAACRADVIDANYTLHIPPVVVPHPGPARVPILLDHPVGQVQGCSFGVCYDTASIELVTVEEGADIFAVMPSGAGFFSVGQFQGGFTLGFVIDLFGFATIPPGLDQELAAATLEPLVPSPVFELLDFCDDLGSPPVDVVVVVANTSLFPVELDGSVAFITEQFRRGDSNFDGVVDIADVLFLGLNLFGSTVDDYPCREACEVNGDAQIDIADMVFTLSYLFSGGTPPGAPFPDCGPDPDPGTGFGCDLGASCP